jgi:hypothetical protein
MKPSNASRVVLVVGLTSAALALGWLVASSPSPAAPAPVEPYGSVTGRFVLDGKAPPRKVLYKKGARVRDAACCAKEDLLSEDLVVDDKTSGIANVCVYLPKAKSVHPRLAKKLGEVRVEQKGCRFVPHVSVVREGQTVRVVNADKCAHTLSALTMSYAALVPPGPSTRVVVRREPGPPFAPVRCQIHPWMQSWWLVLDHPYGAVTDATGKFTIADLPAGAHELRVWHEKVGWINKALKVTVRRGQTTDLGAFPVPVAKFTDP